MTLRADHVSVSLGGRRVVEGFNFETRAGAFVAVVGANGSGKSTVLRVLAGLLQPETGAVTLDQKPVSDFEGLGRHIAYLPQDRNVHWSLKSERVVALGRLPYRSFSAGESHADRRAIDDAMKRMDVSGLANRSVATLSGGERARVLVARALAQEAKYLIADEPTSGLDPAHTLALFEEFRRLAADGHAVVTAIHDLSLAARYATQILLMKEGRCLAFGPPAAVLNNGNLRTAFAIDAIVTEIQSIPVVLPRTEVTN